uniref:Uncharacterized protein N-1 n=1 Tax=Hyposoter didymator TaxID=260305 RepID=D7P5M6_HYPDD|nr:unknown [Hyposoter didymator]
MLQCEDDLEEEYNDEAENGGPEIYQTVSSDDELDGKLAISQSLPVVESMSLECPSVPSLKKIVKRKPTAGGKNVLVGKVRKPDNTAPAGNAFSSEKKKSTIVSKERPAIETLSKGDSAAFAKKSSVKKKKPVLKPKDPKEESSYVPAAAAEESRNKAKVAVKKSSKLVAMAAEEQPPVKKGRRDPKHQPEGVSLPPVTKDGNSPSYRETQVQTFPQVNTSRKNSRTSGGTSTKSFLVLNSDIGDGRFWMETLAGDFASTGYNALLKNSQFTEQQAYLLQHSFYQLCRKLSDISSYSDRFMKTHKCIECDFSISHQCMSIDFSQYVPASANITGVTNIAPQSTTMCVCQFAFFHSHPTQPRVILANTLSWKSCSHMLELNRSLSLRCPRCHMNVVMKNRNNNVCSDFANWNSLEGINRRQFFKSLENRLQASKISRPHLDELYTCNRQCCQLFHRCAENALPDNTMPMRPH